MCVKKCSESLYKLILSIARSRVAARFAQNLTWTIPVIQLFEAPVFLCTFNIIDVRCMLDLPAWAFMHQKVYREHASKSLPGVNVQHRKSKCQVMGKFLSVTTLTLSILFGAFWPYSVGITDMIVSHSANISTQYEGTPRLTFKQRARLGTIV